MAIGHDVSAARNDEAGSLSPGLAAEAVSGAFEWEAVEVAVLGSNSISIRVRNDDLNIDDRRRDVFGEICERVGDTLGHDCNRIFDFVPELFVADREFWRGALLRRFDFDFGRGCLFPFVPECFAFFRRCFFVVAANELRG